MNKRKEYSFPLIVVALVLGWTIFKQFDFENKRFEQPAIVVYILTF